MLSVVTHGTPDGPWTAASAEGSTPSCAAETAKRAARQSSVLSSPKDESAPPTEIHSPNQPPMCSSATRVKEP